jgi:hypothetical protein
VADTGRAAKRLAPQLGLEIAQLAFGATARQLPTFERRHTGGVVAAIFEPLERVDELLRDRLATKNTDDAAHGRFNPVVFCCAENTPATLYAA